MVNSDDETNGKYIKRLVKKQNLAARRILRIAKNFEHVSAVDGNDASIDAAWIDRANLEKCFAIFKAAQNEIEKDVLGDKLEPNLTPPWKTLSFGFDANEVWFMALLNDTAHNIPKPIYLYLKSFGRL